MTGYRLGYLAGPASLMAPITKMHSFMVTCVNDAAQAAAVEAWKTAKTTRLNSVRPTGTGGT